MAGTVFGDRLNELTDHLAAITNDRHIGNPVLSDLRRVDIGVNHLGVWSKAVQLARHSVIETGPQGDQQVRALQRTHGRHRTVHSGHAVVQWVGVREGTTRHQSGDDWHAGQLGELF